MRGLNDFNRVWKENKLLVKSVSVPMRGLNDFNLNVVEELATPLTEVSVPMRGLNDFNKWQ